MSERDYRDYLSPERRAIPPAVRIAKDEVES